MMEHGKFSVKDAAEKKEEQIIFFKTGSLLTEVFAQIFSQCNSCLMDYVGRFRMDIRKVFFTEGMVDH